jgi:hypothetical protein
MVLGKQLVRHVIVIRIDHVATARFSVIAMVEFVRISKDGRLVEIKEVSDKFRDQPYLWEEE